MRIKKEKIYDIEIFKYVDIERVGSFNRKGVK
jgi:hypothetical protein